MNKHAVMSIFGAMDTDGSGSLSPAEFRSGLLELDSSLSDEQVNLSAVDYEFPSIDF